MGPGEGVANRISGVYCIVMEFQDKVANREWDWELHSM